MVMTLEAFGWLTEHKCLLGPLITCTMSRGPKMERTSCGLDLFLVYSAADYELIAFYSFFDRTKRTAIKSHYYNKAKKRGREFAIA